MPGLTKKAGKCISHANLWFRTAPLEQAATASVVWLGRAQVYSRSVMGKTSYGSDVKLFLGLLPRVLSELPLINSVRACLRAADDPEVRAVGQEPPMGDHKYPRKTPVRS
jgi:hypothetical protein